MTKGRPIWVRPSSAPLWSDPKGCWASATFEPPGKGESETSHTLRGTRLHEAVASIIDPDLHQRPRLEDGEWAVAQGAVAELESHVDVDSYRWRVETKVGRRMGKVLVDGTPDLVGIAKERGWRGKAIPLGEPRMVIADFKFGRHNVEAETNYQLMCYAVLLLFGEDRWAQRREWKPDDTIRTMIVQPAMRDVGAGVVKKGMLTYAQAEAERDRLDRLLYHMSNPHTELTYNPTADNCRYCVGARSGECPEVVTSLARVEDQVEGIEDFGLLPPSGYADFLRKCDLVAVMAKHVREDAQRRLERGEPVQDLRLVPGRQGNRKWTDPAECERQLREFGDHGKRVDILVEPVLKSPSVLDREFGACGAKASQEIIRRHYERGPATVAVDYEGGPAQTLGHKRIEAAIEHFKETANNRRD